MHVPSQGASSGTRVVAVEGPAGLGAWTQGDLTPKQLSLALEPLPDLSYHNSQTLGLPQKPMSWGYPHSPSPCPLGCLEDPQARETQIYSPRPPAFSSWEKGGVDRLSLCLPAEGGERSERLRTTEHDKASSWQCMGREEGGGSHRTFPANGISWGAKSQRAKPLLPNKHRVVVELAVECMHVPETLLPS